MKWIFAAGDAMAFRGRVFKKIMRFRLGCKSALGSLPILFSAVLMVISSIAIERFSNRWELFFALIFFSVVILCGMGIWMGVKQYLHHQQLFHQKQKYDAEFQQLLFERNCAEFVASKILDGICLLQGDEVLYANPIAIRILEFGRLKSNFDFSKKPLRLREPLHPGALPIPVSSGASAILSAISRSMPTEWVMEENGRKKYYVLQVSLIPYCPIEGFGDFSQEKCLNCSRQSLCNHSEERSRHQILVLAQDVTLIKESQEAKGHFLGTLSHEIKTPVTSIMMGIRLLDRMVNSPKGDPVALPQARSLIKTCVEEVDRFEKTSG